MSNKLMWFPRAVAIVGGAIAGIAGALANSLTHNSFVVFVAIGIVVVVIIQVCFWMVRKVEELGE